MAVIAHFRSDQTALYVNNSKLSPSLVQLRANATSAIALANVSTESGVFGTKYLDRASASVTRSPMWPGFTNTPSGVAFAILIRIIPRFNGTPAAMDLCLMAGPNPNTSGRIVFSTLATGAFRLNFADADGQTSTSITTTSTKTNYTSGTAVDLMVSWDGTTSSNAVVFGVDGASFETKTSGTAMYTLPSQSHRAGLVVGNGPNAALSNFDLNELVIFDNAQSVVTGTRTQFWTTSAFDASSYSDPGVANVKTGTAYSYAGSSLTGTYDGSDRWTDPGDNNVRNGTAYKANSTTNNKTGRVTVPTAAQVKTGITFETDAGTTGTYDGSDRWTDPGIANVRSGSAYKANSTSNNRTGTAVIPSAANVRSGTSVDATTGTLDLPATTDVKTGVTFDGASKTGSYDGSDRWTDPGVSNVRSGTVYKANSTTNNETGTAAIPGASDVRSGVLTDATTGTLDLPAVSNVKTGITYDGSSKTGTYDGSDRWTDPGVANVRSATAYKANSTTNNRAGTSAIPVASNVRSGVSTDATTGTLDVPSVGNVRSGISVDASVGTLVVPSLANTKIGIAGDGGNGTYDGSDRWSDPGASFVATGKTYKANSTSDNRTGTLDSITNIISNVDLEVQELSAELEIE